MKRRGFTLVELLVVLMVIIALIGLLIPVVGKVRQAAQRADTQQLISNIRNGIERYYTDFQAYPGPLSNDQVHAGTPVPPGISGRVTMAENLVLGLLGGLKLTSSGALYDQEFVGMGPQSLNPRSPRQYAAYLDVRRGSDQLSQGSYKDAEQIAANDSNVPEFVDRFDGRLPILYLRARVGAAGIASDNGNAQYDLRQIIGYTNTRIGGKVHGLKSLGTASEAFPPASASAPPANLIPYLKDPSNSNYARQRDGYILISAGPDGIYGTIDDVCSFGSL